MIPSGIPLISFVLFLLAGLTFTVFNDPYIRRSHRTAMLISSLPCVSPWWCRTTWKTGFQRGSPG